MFFLGGRKARCSVIIIFILCVTIYSKNVLGNTSTHTHKKITAQLLLLIFPEETPASYLHVKPKNLRIKFLSCNPLPGILY